MIVALQLPREIIAQSIPLIWPHLDRFCKRFPAEYSLPDVMLGLLAGRTTGFMAWDDEKQISHAFAFGSLIDDFDGTRSLRMEMIEGDGMADWRDIMEAEFMRFAQANKCGVVRFIGRKGWAKRLPSWKIKYFVFERRMQERTV